MPALPEQPSTPAPTTCGHCGQALGRLAQLQRATHCRSAPCLAKAAQARGAQQQAALGALALQAAGAALGASDAKPPTLVFLQPWQPVQVPVTDAQRQSHHAYLLTVAAEGTVIDDTRLAAHSAVDGLPQADRLCAHCRGHCCQHGLGWHAFMDLRSLQRWASAQADEPDGATLADAVAHFMAQVPAEHADGGCLYQGEQGCVLPREQRADICNGFACPSLQAVQQATLQDPQAAVVTLAVHAGQAQRVALISASNTQPLSLPPTPPGDAPAR